MNEIVEKSQELLAVVVKNTPLTQKLLSRPPFRYLHDLISEIITETGFAMGLFSDFERNANNIKVDREIDFIKKIK